jgi:hypothetical protein
VLNDPTLRMAIGPDKEMPLYEYQKALKQDVRWQYTNNAKEDVSNSVQKVLRDFGFHGVTMAYDPITDCLLKTRAKSNFTYGSGNSSAMRM